MGYCTISLLNTMMPRSVTIGDTGITSPVPVTAPRANTIPISTARRYIRFAGQYVDSRLKQMYVTPLKEVKSLQQNMTQNITSGSAFLMVYEAGSFDLDSVVRVTDTVSSERYTVNEIFDGDPNKIGITPATTRAYSLANTPVVYLIEYPNPIPTICAQIAIGMMFDKIFSAEQSPDVSNFGKTQRTQGSNALDDILQGVIRLEGQEQTGRRFARMSLRDTMATTVEIQHGRDKEV